MGATGRWRRFGAAVWRPRGRAAIFVLIFAVVLFVFAGVGLVAHFRAPTRGWVLGITAFSPYLMLAAPVALILLLVAREWALAPIALAVTAVAVVTQAPLYLATDPSAHSARLVVMTANLKLGGASPAAVLAAVERHHVDVLMLQELTPDEQDHLLAAGLGRVLPQHVSDPRSQALGTGLWSRLPLTDEVRRTDFSWAFVTAHIRVPGVRSPIMLAALHLPGPYPNSVLWNHDVRHLQSVLPGLGDGATTIVGGDFNATPDVHQFRELLTGGWADAAAQAGAGMTRTYPADTPGYPLIAIDHVLTRHAVATSAKTIEIARSDHRALLVTVAVPTG